MSEIIFETFTSGQEVGAADSALPLVKARALDAENVVFSQLPRIGCVASGIVTKKGAIASTLPPMQLFASGSHNTAFTQLPNVQAYARNAGFDVGLNIGFTNLPTIQLAASGYKTIKGEVNTTLPLMRAFASDAENVVASQLPRITLLSYEAFEYDRFFSILQSTGYAYATMGPASLPPLIIEDSFLASDVAEDLLTISIGERLVAVAAISAGLNSLCFIADEVSASDFGLGIYQLIAASQAEVEDDPEAVFNQLLAIADAVFASGVAGTQFTNALLYVALVAELGDRADLAITLSVEDTLEALDDAAIARIALMVQVLDAMVASDEAGIQLRLVALVDDSVEALDDTGTQLTALLDALDTGLVTGRIKVGGDTYSVYAMTLLGQAPSEYTNFNFNSYATIRGRLYGASEAGLFLCEGTDDDGAEISASVRKGLNALGTQLKKAVPYAYIGYTSDGRLALKVTTTDAGTKRVNCYAVNAISRDATADNRFQISKNLHSVYWDFELVNIDGADFELDVIKVWRMALNRRK